MDTGDASAGRPRGRGPARRAPTAAERASAYFSYAGLRDSLGEDGLRITGIVAKPVDGTERFAEAPDDWQRLGRLDKLIDPIEAGKLAVLAAVGAGTIH